MQALALGSLDCVSYRPKLNQNELSVTGSSKLLSELAEMRFQDTYEQVA
jgi:hypothetical protein